jgi:hypothetical protein
MVASFKSWDELFSHSYSKTIACKKKPLFYKLSGVDRIEVYGSAIPLIDDEEGNKKIESWKQETNSRTILEFARAATIWCWTINLAYKVKAIFQPTDQR